MQTKVLLCRINIHNQFPAAWYIFANHSIGRIFSVYNKNNLKVISKVIYQSLVESKGCKR